jgi:hypothetical protein
VQQQVTDLSIALAMPLLLFTLDVRQWRRVASISNLKGVLAKNPLAPSKYRKNKWGVVSKFPSGYQ